MTSKIQRNCAIRW